VVQFIIIYIEFIFHTALQKTDQGKGYVVNCIARLMSVFVGERYFNFAGQHGARLSRGQSIKGEDLWKFKRTWLIRFFSPVLLFTPEKLLRRLRIIYVDQVVRALHWKEYVEC